VKPSVALTEPKQRELGDITGLRYFGVTTDCARRFDIGPELARAGQVARADGKAFGVHVHARMASTVGDSFVLMSLADFSKIAAIVEGVGK
jgi:hypothetical protein